jgi:Kdo-III transferase WaaZ
MLYFLDGRPAEKIRRVLFHRLCCTPRYWHNREFSRSQTIERRHDGGYLVRWPNHGEVYAKAVENLPRHGDACAVVASGPSITRLERPERMFSLPAVCVNGSATLAQRFGSRISYYLVADPGFVQQQPELFRTGVELADAVVLNPPTVFAAMQYVPGLLEKAPVYLQQDLRCPFKRPRATRSQMQKDRRLLVHQEHAMAYSLDLAGGTYSSSTVVYQAVQVLFGIGYQRIFMFGVDLSSQGRFYREKNSSPCYLDKSYTHNILPAFELARAYCEQTGKELVNCSIDSRLPSTVIPKLDGSEALSRLESQMLCRT